VQVLFEQLPLAQTLPQEPQFEALLVVLTQVEPHSVCPCGHVQLPLVHDWPAAQALLQAPQCAGSVAVVRHWLLQNC